MAKAPTKSSSKSKPAKSSVSTSKLGAVKRINPVIAAVIVLALVLIGYLVVRLSFAAGPANPVNYAGKDGCRSSTAYGYQSRYGVYCENGTTVNKRAVGGGIGSTGRSVNTGDSCVGSTTYSYLPKIQVYCEWGTTVNARPGQNALKR